MFPSLQVLDTLDKDGKDQFGKKSMAESAGRVPSSLFDNSK